MRTADMDRRALLRRAGMLATATTALTTASTAIGVPAIAAATTRDPIFDLIAEADRLHALATDISARRDAARESVGDDCAGCGWPPLDMTKPELAEMVPWLERGYGRAWRERDGISRGDIERFNEHLEMTITHGRYDFIPRAAADAIKAESVEDAHKILTAAAERLRVVGADLTEEEERTLTQYQRDGEARLAWLDQRVAERERNAEVSGYRRLGEEAEGLWEKWCDANAAILEAHPVTIEGAVAQLEAATKIIRDGIADGNEEDLDIDKIGTLHAYEALVRLSRKGSAA